MCSPVFGKKNTPEQNEHWNREQVIDRKDAGDAAFIKVPFPTSFLRRKFFTNDELNVKAGDNVKALNGKIGVDGSAQ
jgi:hypothetical protein